SLAHHLHHSRHLGGLCFSAEHLGYHHSQRRRSALSDRHLRHHVSLQLQPRQSLPHGPHHLHRFRRRRCHRRHRKHHPPHRKRHETFCRRHEGLKRNRFHSALHEHLPRRRVHPHPHDAGHRWPPLPRICRRSQRRHRRLP